MKTRELDLGEIDAVRESLDYDDTADLVGALFGWRPDPLTRALVGALSLVVYPLEQGSYFGKSLPGEPHRASWVISGPLTVFGMEGTRYRKKVMLAARLRHSSDINMIDVGPDSAEAAARSLRSAARKARKRDRRASNLRSLGFEGDAGASQLELLLAVQGHSDMAVSLVPVVRTSNQLTPPAPTVSFAVKVDRVRPWKLFQKLTSLWRTMRTGSLKNGRALVLKPWLEGLPSGNGDSASALVETRIELANRMNAERRACEGPPHEPVTQVRRRVLSDPVLTACMQDYGLREGLSPAEVLDEANGYIDEIASDNRIGVVRWFVRCVDFLFDRFLEKIDTDREGLRFLSECDSRNRIVLVCSHKSYVDPLLIGYTLFRSGMVPPQQAAGLNLDFWPVGWLLRHSGAFFLRRTFSGEKLYREVFCAYVRYLLAGNFTSVVYIEGTRSRDGKLAKPKLGYMGILADSLRMGVCPDVTLVPVYMGYDKVAEEGAHVKEMAGSRKVSESVKGFTNIYRSMNTRLGRAFVKFGTPASMNALLADGGVEGAANAMCEAINGITPVTARSLAAFALLAPGSTWVATDEVVESAEALMRFARAMSMPLVDEDGSIEAALEWFAKEGRIVAEESDGVPGYAVRGQSRRYLEYNKNIPVAHFLPGALVAVARSSPAGVSTADLDTRTAEDVSFLRDLLSEEFVFGTGDWESEIERASRCVHGDTSVTARALSSLLSSALEAYLVAANALEALTERVAIPREEFIDCCFEEGERLLKEGTIEREESLSKVAFKNAARRFEAMGLVETVRETGEDGKETVMLMPGARLGDLPAILKRIESFLMSIASPSLSAA